MRLTKIAGLAFIPRQRALARQEKKGEAVQREVLRKLVEKAQHTEFGKAHGFADIQSYDDFAKRLGINTYEDLKESIDRMRHGESDILWPGTVKWYAKSSGTTNDKSKFIPVSAEGLPQAHYKVLRAL